MTRFVKVVHLFENLVNNFQTHPFLNVAEVSSGVVCSFSHFLC